MGFGGSSSVFRILSLSLGPIFFFFLFCLLCESSIALTNVGAFKQHTCMISWCLWVWSLGTANLGLWLQALPTKTKTKRSSSTEVSSEGLTGEGSAAKLMWFLKEVSSWCGGLLDREPCCQLSARGCPRHLNLSPESSLHHGSFFHQSQQGRVC